MTQANIERKCDCCDNVATHFASPCGNPDEAALCDKHYEKLIASANKGERVLTVPPLNTAAFQAFSGTSIIGRQNDGNSETAKEE